MKRSQHCISQISLMSLFFCSSISWLQAVDYGHTWFAGRDAFFAAATTAGAASDALVRLALAKIDGVWQPSPLPLANSALISNQIFQEITTTPNTAIVGQTGKGTVLAASQITVPTTAVTVYAIDPVAGTNVAASTALNDAAGSTAEGIDDLVASKNTVFAAVTSTSNTGFGTANAGIARLDLNVTNNMRSLTPVIARDGTAGNNAYKVSLSITDDDTGTGIASIARVTPATTSNGVATLWWDDPGRRLFVGLSDISSMVNGSVCPILVGALDDNTPAQLLLRTLINPNEATFDWSSLFTAGDATQIIGFKNDATLNRTTSIIDLRTMHTSTGRWYLIVNGGTADNATDLANLVSQVYALPLTPDGFLGQPTSPSTNPFIDVTSDMMPDSTNPKFIVGNNPNILRHDETKPVAITEIQVIGDTVYISLAGIRDTTNKQEAGIFASTALFDANGIIRAWTPWAPVLGSRTAVEHFGVDQTTLNQYHMGTNALTSFQATTWGTESAPGSLNTALDTLASQGGILRLIPFDENTPNFMQPADPATEYPVMSLMVATGIGSIALIQTGARDNNAVYQPTTQFIYTSPATATSITTDTVHVFENDPALQQLGPIYAADFSRSADLGKTWLCVGGLGGVAVLRRSTNGAGFNPLTINPNIVPIAPLASGTFAQLLVTNAAGATTNPFVRVRALHCDGTWLYILTNDALYRVLLAASNFDGQNLATTDVITLLTDPTKLPGLTSHDQLLQMFMIDSSKLLLGTTKGLFTVTINTNGTISNMNKIPVTASDDSQLGPVLDIQTIWSQNGQPNPANCNLYITAYDTTQGSINVYRFDVQAGNITPFNEPYATPYFYRIGNTANVAHNREIPFGFDHFARAKDFGATNLFFVDGIAVTPDPKKFLPVPPSTTPAAINLENIVPNYTVITSPSTATLTRNPASGALYVPHELGIRANQ